MARQRIKFSRVSNDESNRTKQVAGYIRVSSDEETENGSLAVQEKTIRDFCLEEDMELVDLYVDEGHSVCGEISEHRPEYLRMMAAVEEGRFDIVVTHTFDHMSPDFLNMFRTVQTFQKHGVSFVSIKENLDFSSPLGLVLMALFSALAQMQSTNAKEDNI